MSRPGRPTRRASRPRLARPSRRAGRDRVRAARRAPAGGATAAPAGRAADACVPASAHRGALRPARRGLSTSSRTRSAITVAWSRRYILNSVAIWSLRERPARSRPPSSGPSRSSSPRSRAEWTSSSSGCAVNSPDSTVGSQRVDAGDQRGEVVAAEQPGCLENTGMCARTSKVVRRETPVEVSRTRERDELR